jgi:hypothetical protein
MYGLGIAAMTAIREFLVTEPATSGGVLDMALEAIRTRSRLELKAYATAISDRYPRGQEIEVAVRVIMTRHPREGGMRLIGEPEQGHKSINLMVLADADHPATFSMVVDEEIEYPPPTPEELAELDELARE